MFRRKSKDWQPEDLTATMVARNAQLWVALTQAGVTDETELRLDFFYDSAGSASDAELAAFLGSETDYEVLRTSEQYGVTGSTQPTAVSQQKLDDWVAWMVLAGHEHGRCKFDGWGAAIPKAS
jgi:hypothetical protein